MKNIIYSLFLIGSIALISSCEKDEATPDAPNTSNVDDTDTTDVGSGDGTDLSTLDFNVLYADGTPRTTFNYFKFAPAFNSTEVTINFSELENEFENGQDLFDIGINTLGDNYLPSDDLTTYNYQEHITNDDDGQWTFRFCPEGGFPDEVYDCHATETEGFQIVTNGVLTLAIDGNQITLSFVDLDIYGTIYSGKFRFTSSEVFESDYEGEWIEGPLE